MGKTVTIPDFTCAQPFLSEIKNIYIHINIILFKSLINRTIMNRNVLNTATTYIGTFVHDGVLI